jgi:hypothetical protein
MANPEGVQETLGRRFANLKHKTAPGMVVYPGQRQQQVKLGSRHFDASHQDCAISLSYIVVGGVDQVVNESQPKSNQIYRNLFGQLLGIVLIVFKRLRAKEDHVWSEPCISVLDEDRLRDITFVLLGKTFSELNSGKRPLVDVQLEILQDSSCLSSLPLDEVE